MGLLCVQVRVRVLVLLVLLALVLLVQPVRSRSTCRPTGCFLLSSARGGTPPAGACYL